MTKDVKFVAENEHLKAKWTKDGIALRQKRAERKRKRKKEKAVEERKGRRGRRRIRENEMRH